MSNVSIVVVSLAGSVKSVVDEAVMFCSKVCWVVTSSLGAVCCNTEFVTVLLVSGSEKTLEDGVETDVVVV